MRPFFRALPPLAAVVLLASSVMAGPSVGSKAPDFTATAMSGKTFRLSQFRGKSPVIVNFFSTT